MNNTLSITILFVVCCTILACASMEEKENDIIVAQNQLNTKDGVDKHEAVVIARFTAKNQSLPIESVPNKPFDGGDAWIFDLSNGNPTSYEELDTGNINWSVSYLVYKNDGRVKTVGVPDLELLGIDREKQRELETKYLNIKYNKSLDMQDAIIVAERYIYNEKYTLGLDYEVPHNPTNLGNKWTFKLKPKHRGLEELVAVVTIIDGEVTIENENHRLSVANFRQINVKDGIDQEEALIILQFYYYAKNNWYTVWDEPKLPIDDGQFWRHDFKLPPESKDKNDLSVKINKSTGNVLVSR